MDRPRSYAEAASPDRSRPKTNPEPPKLDSYDEAFPSLPVKYPDGNIRENRLHETPVGNAESENKPLNSVSVREKASLDANSESLNLETVVRVCSQKSKRPDKGKTPQRPVDGEISHQREKYTSSKVTKRTKSTSNKKTKIGTTAQTESATKSPEKLLYTDSQPGSTQMSHTPTSETLLPETKTPIIVKIPDMEELTRKRHSDSESRLYCNYPYPRALKCSDCSNVRHLYFIQENEASGERKVQRSNDRLHSFLMHVKKDHTTNALTTRWLICRVCNECSPKPMTKSYTSSTWWRNHIKDFHEDELIVFQKEKRSGDFVCSKCREHFHSNQALTMHACTTEVMDTEEIDSSTLTPKAVSHNQIPDAFKCIFFRADDPVDWLDKLYTDETMNWVLSRISLNLESAQVIEAARWTGAFDKELFAYGILDELCKKKYTFIPICENSHWRMVIIKNVDEQFEAIFLDPKQPTETPRHIEEAFAKINVIWKDNSDLYSRIPKQESYDTTECGPLICSMAFVFEQLINEVEDPIEMPANEMRCAIQIIYNNVNGTQTQPTTQTPVTPVTTSPPSEPSPPIIPHLPVPSALQCFFLEKGLNAWYTDKAMTWAIKQTVPFPSADTNHIKLALEQKESLKPLVNDLKVAKTILLPHCINRTWCAVVLRIREKVREAQFIHPLGLDVPEDIRTLVESQTAAKFSPKTFPDQTQPHATSDNWHHSGIHLLHLILQFDNHIQNSPATIPTQEEMKKSLKETILEKLSKGSRDVQTLCKEDDRMMSDRKGIPDLFGLSISKSENKVQTPDDSERKRKSKERRKMKEATKTWFATAKESYLKEGRAFAHFEWLANKTGLLISHATRDRMQKHTETLASTTPTNTEQKPSTYKPKKDKPNDPKEKKTYPNIVAHYTVDPSDAYHSIIDPPSTRCSIPTIELEDYFRKINAEPEHDPELVKILAASLPPLDIPPTFTDPFTYSEVEYLMKKAKKDSAPGNDGLSYGDWQSIDTNHSIMLFIVNECAHHELIPVKWKSSKCTLIYKKGLAEDPENWRPITLLPTIHKIYAGLWDKRITKIPNLFSKEQTGFQEETGTGDNIIILRMALDHAHEEKGNPAFAFIDIRNAFGSITHETIHTVIEQTNMPKKLQNIVKDMYNGCSTRYISTEGYTKPIELQVGTKQGDTISPTLFNLVLEILIRRHLARSEGYAFLDHVIKLLAFADDIVIAAKDKDTLEKELNLLALEAKALNLEFKPSKCASLVFQSGTINDTALLKILGKEIPILDKDGHYPYLGIPMGFLGKFPITDLMEEIDKKATLVIKSDLTVSQKLDALQTFLLPKLTYTLSYGTPRTRQLMALDTLVKDRIKNAANIPLLAAPPGYLYSPKDKACLGFTSVLHTSRILLITTFLKILWHKDETMSKLFTRYLIHHINKHKPGQCKDLKSTLEYMSSPASKSVLERKAPTMISRICSGIYYFTKTENLFEYFTFALENNDVTLEIKEKYSGKIIKITRRQHKDCTKIIRKAVQRTTFDSWMSEKKTLSNARVILEASKRHESHHFLYNNQPYLSGANQNFIHFARLGLTDLKDDLLMWKYDKQREYKSRRDPQTQTLTQRDTYCRGCTSEDETKPKFKESLLHVLNCCPLYSHGLITDRHNSIQDLLLQGWKLGEKQHYNLKIASTIPETGKLNIPDIVIRGKPEDSDIEEILIIDVTCPFDRQDTSLDKAHQDKIDKYQELADILNKQNSKVSAKVYSMVIGSLGTFRKGNYETYKAMAIPHDIQLLLAKLMVNSAISWSRYIYWSHVLKFKYTISLMNKPPKNLCLMDFIKPQQSKSPLTDDYEPPTKIRRTNQTL